MQAFNLLHSPSQINNIWIYSDEWLCLARIVTMPKHRDFNPTLFIYWLYLGDTPLASRAIMVPWVSSLVVNCSTGVPWIRSLGGIRRTKQTRHCCPSPSKDSLLPLSTKYDGGRSTAEICKKNLHKFVANSISHWLIQSKFYYNEYKFLDISINL